MRLIKVTGGLGNQMFIYAFYLRMKKYYPKVRIDLSDMMHYKVHYGYEMHRVFNLPHTEFCINQPLKKVIEFLFFKKIYERKQAPNSLRAFEKKYFWPLLYFKGFYQSERFFADIKDEEALKREFAAALNPETEEEKSDNVRTKFQIGLKDVLVEETVQVLDHVLPWEDAIQTVAKPLLDRGDITERYVQKAIDNIKADKPFIMIADGVIIAHAGVDDGAKRVCLSLLTMPERTDVYGYMEADVVIMIGTPDPTKHLEVLEQLNHIIEDKKSLQLLKKAKKPEDIIKLIQKREKEKKKC